jgi:hypothetical protein
MLQALTSATGPLSKSPESAFTATSEIPKPSPAAMPSSTPRCTGMRSTRWERTRSKPMTTAMLSKRIIPARE